MGNQSLLAFFEYPPDAPRGNRDALGGMQQLAFHTNRANFESFCSIYFPRQGGGAWVLGDHG